MMTTKNVINAIQSRFKESEPIICMEFLSDSREDETIVTKLRDSVVVTSDEGSLLNYAVMKYSGISSNGSSMRRFTIGKLCSPPAGTSVKFHYGNRRTSGCVLPYPSDMIEFLKKTTRFHAISVVSESSLTRLDHASVDKVERNKDIFLFNNCMATIPDCFGIPIYDSDLNVVGMLSFEIYINHNTRSMPRYMCCTAVRIDTIVNDIYRKIPELAKKIFPDFRDTC